MKSRLVSVVMPVKNASLTIYESISSILSQEFQDFEFLIIDDASTDNSVSIIESFDDPRISLVKLEKSRGVANIMNMSFALCKGKYIARMDADDICLKDRLIKQFAYLETHPDVGVLGSWVQLFGDGVSGKKWIYPEDHDSIEIDMLFYNPIAQPTVMIRSNFFKKFKITYDPNYSLNNQKTEDYELWSRAINFMRFANLQEVLLYYRVTSSKISLDKQRVVMPIKVRTQLLKNLGVEFSDKEKLVHTFISEQRLSARNFRDADRWIIKLIQINAETKFFNQTVFTKRLEKIFFNSTKLMIGSSFAKIGAILSPRTSSLSTYSKYKLLTYFVSELAYKTKFSILKYAS